MVNNLYQNFLVDPEQYGLSEQHWEELWIQIDPFHRENLLWTNPWLGTGSPGIKDGNPIFSAYSPVLRRGIRVIQEEPIGSGLDIRVWLDTFGGGIIDPDRIHELVISCTLSDVTSKIAFSLMSSWVQERPISFRSDEAKSLLPSSTNWPRRNRSFEFAA